jgi:hypothetical protein
MFDCFIYGLGWMAYVYISIVFLLMVITEIARRTTGSGKNE